MTQEEKKEKKRLYDIEYRKKNADKIKKQQFDRYNNLSDEEKIKMNKERYSKLDKEKKKLDDKKYAKKHKDKLNQKKIDWAKANPEKHRKSKTDYFLRKLAEDNLFKLKHTISCSIKRGLKNNGYVKKIRTHEILGCSFNELKSHLESKFESWMTWDNHGNQKNGILEFNKTWDIDHIEPISSAITEEDVIRLNHYTNLQPLCSKYNREVKRNLFLNE